MDCRRRRQLLWSSAPTNAQGIPALVLPKRRHTSALGFGRETGANQPSLEGPRRGNNVGAAFQMFGPQGGVPAVYPPDGGTGARAAPSPIYFQRDAKCEIGL